MKSLQVLIIFTTFNIVIMPQRMAEREGFEPSIQVTSYNGLANRCFQPLSHLSLGVHCNNITIFIQYETFIVFAPTRYKSGFPRLVQPPPRDLHKSTIADNALYFALINSSSEESLARSALSISTELIIPTFLLSTAIS